IPGNSDRSNECIGIWFARFRLPTAEALLNSSGSLCLPTDEDVAVTEKQENASTLGPVLAQRIGDKRYQLWFAEKTQFHWQADLLIVSVPNRFFQEWLQKTFTSAVSAAAREVSGQPATVRFVIDPSLFHTAGRHLEPASPAMIPHEGENGAHSARRPSGE